MGYEDVLDEIEAARSEAQIAFELLETAFERVLKAFDSAIPVDEELEGFSEGAKAGIIKATEVAMVAHADLVDSCTALKRNAESVLKLFEEVLRVLQMEEERLIPECPMDMEGYPLCEGLAVSIAEPMIQ